MKLELPHCKKLYLGRGKGRRNQKENVVYIRKHGCQVYPSPMHPHPHGQPLVCKAIWTHKTRCSAWRALHKPLCTCFPAYLWMGSACLHAFLCLIFPWDLPTFIPVFFIFFYFFAISTVIFIKANAVQQINF